MTYHKLPFPKVICQTTTFKWAKKGKKTRQKATIDDLFSVKYILADAWLTWERICLKLIFWLQVEEIRVALWKFRII